MTNTTATTIGQLYKKQGSNGPIARRNEFTVLLDAVYVEEGFNVKGQIYREVVDSMKVAYVKGDYVPKMVVEPNADGTKFKVIDGHHRFTALTELVAEGQEYRRVEVEGFSGNQADQVKLMITSSQGRNLTPLERSNGYDRLVNKFGWTRQEVADGFLVHLSSVAHHLAIAELPDSIKVLIAADRIAADYAVELNRKGGEQAVINVVENAGQKKATRTTASAWRPVNGRNVCVLLKSVNVRREGDHMVARFTDEEWEKIQTVLETLNTEG